MVFKKRSTTLKYLVLVFSLTFFLYSVVMLYFIPGIRDAEIPGGSDNARTLLAYFAAMLLSPITLWGPLLFGCGGYAVALRLWPRRPRGTVAGLIARVGDRAYSPTAWIKCSSPPSAHVYKAGFVSLPYEPNGCFLAAIPVCASTAFGRSEPLADGVAATGETHPRTVSEDTSPPSGEIDTSMLRHVRKAAALKSSRRNGKIDLNLHCQESVAS